MRSNFCRAVFARRFVPGHCFRSERNKESAILPMTNESRCRGRISLAKFFLHRFLIFVAKCSRLVIRDGGDSTHMSHLSLLMHCINISSLVERKRICVRRRIDVDRAGIKMTVCPAQRCSRSSSHFALIHLKCKEPDRSARA